MITGEQAQHLTFAHDTVVLAVQEYMARHFVSGACPRVQFVQEELTVRGERVPPAERKFRVQLGKPLAPDAEPTLGVAGTRLLTIEA
jgi:hypothetical protein